MKPYRLKVEVLLTFSGILSIFIFAITLIAFHKANINELGEILLHYGLMVLPISGLWWLFEKHAWHWKIMQNIRTSLNIPPDLRGRWEGIFKRENEFLEYDYVIEIKQTLSKIWVNTYSNQSSAQSYIAEIATNDSEDEFTICFSWLGHGGDDIPKVKSHHSIFDGYTMLTFFDDGETQKLSGKYFTNREPQTKGKIDLTFVTWKRKGKF